MKAQHNRFLFAIVPILPLLTLGNVHAAGFNLTTAGSSVVINGAIFEAIQGDEHLGRDPFVPVVRLSSVNPGLRGYNTDYRPVQFDENNSGTFNRGTLLSDLLQVGVNGTVYREFQLDINQEASGNLGYITLDNVELYESPYADLCGYPFDGSGGGHSGCITNLTATLLYGMDFGEDDFIVLDYRNNEGAGLRDLRLLIPNSSFNSNPDCNYGETECAVYITLYSEFGTDSDPVNDDPLLRISYPNNDGFEEWGVPASELMFYDGFEPVNTSAWQGLANGRTKELGSK